MWVLNCYPATAPLQFLKNLRFVEAEQPDQLNCAGWSVGPQALQLDGAHTHTFLSHWEDVSSCFPSLQSWGKGEKYIWEHEVTEMKLSHTCFPNETNI